MKLLIFLCALVASVAATSIARADPTEPTPWSVDPSIGVKGSLYASRRVCAPGSQVTCSCANGGRGSQTCDPAGLSFSLCACAAVKVTVPQVVVPQVVVPRIDFRRPRHRPSRRYSGLGMLIAGSVILTVGAPNLIWGIDRVRESTNADAPGILSIVHGGLCITTGLPLLIVGSVLLATRGLNPDQDQEIPTSKRAPLFTLTPTGFAAQF
jgi:hypothetical protein